jgi:hypothetical protein
MSDEQHWWYCLRHHQVEPDAGCPNKDRLGPYNTREQAEHALDTVHRRNEEWDATDDK